MNLKSGFEGTIQHWFLYMYFHINPLVFKKHIIKPTCESVITMGAHVFEKYFNVLLGVCEDSAEHLLKLNFLF